MKNLQKSTFKIVLATIAYISLPVSLANARFIPSFCCLNSESSEVVTPNPLYSYHEMSIEKGDDKLVEYSLNSESSEVVMPNPLYKPISDEENDFMDHLVSKGIASKLKDALVRIFDKNYQYKKTLLLIDDAEDSINIKSKSKNSSLLWDAEDTWSSISSSSSTLSWESQRDPWDL